MSCIRFSTMNFPIENNDIQTWRIVDTSIIPCEANNISFIEKSEQAGNQCRRLCIGCYNNN